MLGVVGKTADTGLHYVPVLAVAFAILALAAMVATVWSLVRTRGYRRRAEEHEAAALLVARAIKSSESEPWSEALRSRLRQELHDDEASDHLRRLLRRHPEVRLNELDPGEPRH